LPTDFQELSFHLTTDDATSLRHLHATNADEREPENEKCPHQQD
jgi:hypothetical protein